MTRCEICGNQWSDAIMYITNDGRVTCIHCLDADEKAEKFKSADKRNAELVETIKRTISHLKCANQSNPKRVPDKPLNCVENYERHLELIDQYLYIAIGELSRAIA